MSAVVAVCLPLADQVCAATFRSIMELDLPRPFALEDRRGAPVEDARNDIVGRVLYDPDCASVTHLLWIDDDMVFAPDAFRRLLAHDLPVVGGLCHGRRAPHYAPILCYRAPRGALGYAYRHEYPRGLVEVDATGAAFLLVKREVFEAIEARYPEDGIGPFSNHGRDVLGCGEDISFCERAKACGYSIHVDTTVEVGHLGEVVIDSDFAARNRRADFNPWFPPYPAGRGEPVASIVIPTWNQKPEWLREAVASALAQTVPCEVIVVDDGSDGKLPPTMRRPWPLSPVAPLLEELVGPGEDVWPTAGGSLLFPRNVRLVTIPHAGCFPALNAGIRAMRTEWFCWLSSDDVFRPVKVERQLKATLAGEARASFHGFDVLHEGDRFDRHVYVPHVWKSLAEQQHMLAAACMINGLSVMIHRSVFDEVGLFDAERFPIVADWHMWNKIAQRFFWLPVTDSLATRRDYDNASTRYQADPVKLAQWRAEDQAVRSMFAPRCPDCGRALAEVKP